MVLNHILLIFFVNFTFYESTKLYSKKSIEHCTENPSNIAALILARGGSKGIPFKNLEKIQNKTLIGRSLEILGNTNNLFTEIWVSTDQHEIGEEAEKYNANVHFRPINATTDQTTSIDSVQEFLEKHKNIQNLALIQCTSVFLKEKYLKQAVRLFQENRKVDCVFAVTRSFKLRWKWNENIQALEAINFDPSNRPRRQDWKGELVETGMFYFAKRHLLENGLFQNERCKFVVIDPNDALEIDSYKDLDLARLLIKYNKF